MLGDLTYEYDAAGNRTEVDGTWARTGLPQSVAAATYDAANQMLTFGSQTLAYDANGNLTNDGSKTYVWNARNQLVSMTGGSFSYGGLGRRLQKTVGGATTDFLYDGINPVQELSGGTPVANLLTGLSIDEYFTRGTETLLTNALGSTVALTDSAAAVQTEYTYEPFGKTTASGPASTNPFQFTGRENDETGLYYYRLRYYSPSLHRFVSKDPFPGLGFLPQSLNGYSYVLNSPLLYVDPYGLFILDSAGVTIIFVDISFDFNTGGVTVSAVYPPQLAAGVSKCSGPDTGSGGNPDTSSGGGRKDRPANEEPPLEELLHPVKLSGGVNRYLGASVDANGNICVNVGLPIPGPAATVSVPVVKFDTADFN